MRTWHIVLFVGALLPLAVLGACAPVGHSPLADVTITGCTPDSAKLLITNHSSKQSDYIVSMNYDQDGVKMGEGIAFSDHIDAGQSAVEDVSFTGDNPHGGTCRVKEVTRHAS